MRNAGLLGVIPRTALYGSFPGTFLYVGLHKRGSANLKVPIITNIPDAPAELTMTGTEDYATNIGRQTFNGSSWIISLNSALLDFLSIPTDGQMFVRTRVNIPAAPGSAEYLYSIGLQNNSNGYGGYGEYIATSRARQQLVKVVGGPVTTLANATGTITAATDTQNCTFWDLKNLTVSNWRNGSSVTSNTLTSNAALIPDPAVGLAIGVRNDVAAGTTPNPFVNTHPLSDILFFKPPTGYDMTAHASALATALLSSKAEPTAYLRHIHA